MNEIRWWRWITEPWNASMELAAIRLAWRYRELLDRYPRLREWPRDEVLQLALETRGVDPAVAARAVEKWRAAAEHEQAHR